MLERAHPTALLLGLGLLGVSLVTKSLRWRSMLPAPGEIGRTEAVRIFHVAILLNNLLPFRVGDGARVLSPSVRRAATIQQALVVIVAERILDGLALLAVAFIVLPVFFNATGGEAFANGISAPGTSALLIFGSGLAVGLIALIVAAGVRWQALKLLVTNRIQSLRADILAVVQQPPRHLVMVVAATALAWATTFLVHYAVLEALDAPGSVVNPVLLGVVVTLATNFAMLAPATPGGIGIVHAAAAAPLLVAGMSSEVAVAYAILVHAVNTVPPMLVGAASLGVPVLAARIRGRTVEAN